MFVNALCTHVCAGCRSADADLPFRHGKMSGMGPTLQLNLAAVRDIASRVADAAAAISAEGYRLRISLGSPAADTTTLVLTRQLYNAARQLSYVAEGAADELARANEAIIEYANNAAALARRTELAVLMGLDVEDLVTGFSVSAARSARQAEDTSGLTLPALDSDHRALGEAVLLSSGIGHVAHPSVDTAHLRAAASMLHQCARELRTAIGSGERPAATLDRFGSWVEDHFIPALVSHADDHARWAATYSAAREQVHESVSSYRRWLAAAAAGGSETDVPLSEMAAHVRAVLRSYAAAPIGGSELSPHPRLGEGPE
ncbi:hypothetical protein LIX17_26115 (plasmid) [Mycobacterium avium subsp. hominissuis]|uniref:hypothetical protein n=1 Tax=Mycobacterium avium TaxID=1764 RepID=UPI0031403836